MKIVHVISGLGTGGAETMLWKLVTSLDPGRWASEVVSLTGIGPVGVRLQQAGIPVRVLEMRPGVPDPRALLRLGRLLRRSAPDLVQTWMYHADLLGGLAARLAGSPPVIWGVRHSNLDPALNKSGTLWVARGCARLSRRLPRRILCCSEQARRVHVALGYDPSRMLVIPNGFDLQVYRPDREARLSVRRELGLRESVPLIGLVARFDPQKDHRNFIAAAGRLQAQMPQVHFLLCGRGVDGDNRSLGQWIGERQLADRMHLLGPRSDIPRITAALDIAVSSSAGEGFPNVLGEAMACGVPCVATDVGDSALLIGDTGRIVPPSDAAALARAWRQMLELDPGQRRSLGRSARQRVEQHFSLPVIVGRYQRLYSEVTA